MPSPKADAAHEALCERCGVSCHATVPLPDGRQVVLEDLHCVFYGTAEDGKPGCTVYKERFTKAPWCLDSTSAATLGALRLGCPYTGPGMKPGKVRLSPEDYDQAWPEIVAALVAFGPVQPNFTWKKFLRSVEKRDPGYIWRLRLNVTKTTGEVTRRKSVWAKLQDALRG